MVDIIGNNIRLLDFVGDAAYKLFATAPNPVYGWTLDKALILVIVTAITSGAVAYISNFLHWKRVSFEEQKSKFAQDLIGQIDTIEEDSRKYWLQSYNPRKAMDLASLEIKLKNNIKFLSSNIQLFHKTIVSGISSKLIIQINGLTKRLYDQATGGSFESVDRKASKQKSLEISTICTKMKILIFKTSIEPK